MILVRVLHGAMEQALMNGVLQTSATLQYQHCDNAEGVFITTVDPCNDCLRYVPSSNVLVSCGKILLPMAWSAINVCTL